MDNIYGPLNNVSIAMKEIFQHFDVFITRSTSERACLGIRQR